MQSARSIEEILAELRDALRENYGREWEEVTAVATDGKKFRAPFPSKGDPSNGKPRKDSDLTPAPPTDEQLFLPSPFQLGILEALEGKAMRARQLGTAVGDVSRLYRAGGLQELREHGRIKHHERLGFYRPDAPPPELEGE